MTDAARLTTSAVDMYHQDGFAIVKMFDENQVGVLEGFATSWIYQLLAEWTAGKEDSFPLESYHIWSKSLPIDHSRVFQAQNRHRSPDAEVENALINDRLKDFLSQIGLKEYRVWDEGLGWLAFRFIRPGAGDGYPMSRKAWGVATNVISCWVPIIGHSSSETLTLVPGSHLKDYDKYLPSDGKFRSDEYRLSDKYANLELYRPNLARGEVILYHPKTLHSEDVAASNVTRLNLEFRINPVQPPA